MSDMRCNWKSAALALACLLSMNWVEAHRWAALQQSDGPPLVAPPAAAIGRDAAPGLLLVERSRGRIPSPADAPSAHASAIAALPNGDLLAYWWAGKHESAPDVRVFMSRYSGAAWSPPIAVVDRNALGAELGHGIRRLGNPVVWVARDGRVHLFVVATGLGGWAASRVVQLISADQGRNFAAVRVLPLSPLFNTSVLVRNNPVATADGGWLLPLHFELGNKFAKLAAFNSGGTLRWLSRIGSSKQALQPALIRTSGTRMTAVMRSKGGRHKLQSAVSDDGGRNWEDQPDSELFNHDSAAAALTLTDGSLVLAHNHLPAFGTARQTLVLSTSGDGRQWVRAIDVRHGVPNEEFSYPSLQQVGSQLHLTYTDRRQSIMHKVYDINSLVIPP